eukprot:TRINITY_DN10059_c0_g1_i1.p1 TRINITY_DN10059_c0_g1~~TRINITY_DN10059_c0_g1_i1.p1  ORF type:complete len:233 (+),score=22.91 TRINITY_DN10059_c0_g1_i1:52-750(+)
MPSVEVMKRAMSPPPQGTNMPLSGVTSPSPTHSGGHEGVLTVVWRRTAALILLMLLQSLSQFILETYEQLVSEHVIVPLFLTMLIGAGGNAGNQAAVHSITGLVTGEYTLRSFKTVIVREACIGVLCATILTFTGMLRVYLFYDAPDRYGDSYAAASAFAICTSLFFIVLTSVIVGSSLPFFLERIGLSREHAAPVIQVIMDIMGVFITCHICYSVLPVSKPRYQIPTHKEV